MIKNMTKSDIYLVQRAIRDIFSRSKHYKKIKANALSKEKGVRGGKRLDCCACDNSFTPSNLQLHHSPPILEGDIHYDEISFNEFVRRVWADEDNIFPLCKKCHLEQHRKEEKDE